MLQIYSTLHVLRLISIFNLIHYLHIIYIQTVNNNIQIKTIIAFTIEHNTYLSYILFVLYSTKYENKLVISVNCQIIIQLTQIVTRDSANYKKINYLLLLLLLPFLPFHLINIFLCNHLIN